MNRIEERMEELNWKLMQRFLQIEGQQKPVLLSEGDGCAVVDRGSVRTLWLRAPWQPSFAQLARRFGVEDIWADDMDEWSGDSIDFLDQLSGVRSLRIATSQRIDWTPLERQRELESVGIFSYTDKQNSIDFTRLPALRKCSISPWCPEFDAIRHCPWLKSLFIRESGSLRELDLCDLEKLEELLLFQCYRLRAIHLAEGVRIRSLQVSLCPRLRLDLKRYVQDLEYLCLEGGQAYPLDELVHATRLKELTFAMVCSKAPIPSFMHALPCLRKAVICGTDLSEQDQRIVERLAATRQERLGADR